MRYFLFLLTTTLTLFANEEQTIGIIDKEPSAIVDGILNVVSGDLISQETFGFVKGSVPYTIQSAYTSHYMDWGIDKKGWVPGNHAKLHTHEVELGYGCKWITYSYNGSFGQRIYYTSDKEKFGLRKHEPDFSPKSGLTNNGPEISGRSNLKNVHLWFQYLGIKEIRTGSGLKVIFGERDNSQRPNDAEGSQYVLNEIEYPNGFKFKNDNLYNRAGKPFATKEARIHHHTHNTVVLKNQLSDGKTYDEHYIYTEKGYFLTALDRSFAPVVFYNYDQSNWLITKRTLPCDRYLTCEYHGKNVSLEPKVKAIYQPLGKDASPVPSHHVFYNCQQGTGSTDVYNAEYHLNKYLYINNRLVQVKHLQDDNKTPLRLESLFYGDYPNDSNLLATAICNGALENAYVHEYHYDDRGNPTSEWQFGNFTGKSPAPIAFDGKRSVINPRNYENRVTIREYQPHNNLLIKENNSRTVTRFGYFKNTDLISKKLTLVSNAIKERQFFDYDINNGVCEEIHDDGITDDPNDLKGVTFRKIRKIVNNAQGLPLEEETFFYDFEKQAEVFFTKKVNTLDVRGNLVYQELFDTLHNLVKTSSWEYDNHDNCIKEIDPAGNVKTYQYDPLDNLICEEGPIAECKTLYAYDFMNRMIKKEVYFGPEVFTTHYEYNLMGRLISEIDPNGHETKNIYDKQGNLIEKILPGSENTPSHIRMKYNYLGQCTSIIDPLGNELKIDSTIDGLPYKKVYPDQTEEKWVYNFFKEPVEHTSKNGLKTTFERDFKGRVIKEKGIGTKTFEYDQFRLLSETDEEGNKTTYRYDWAGRLIESRKLDKSLAFEYDPSGRIKRRIHSGIKVEVFEYDQMDRIIEERTENLNGEILLKNNKTYDRYGRLVQETSANSSTTYIYNLKGEIVETIDANGHSTLFHTDPHFIDDLGRKVIKKMVVDPLGTLSEVIFDPLGKKVQEIKKNPHGQIIEHSLTHYDLKGRATQVVQKVMGTSPHNYIIELGYSTSDQLLYLIEGVGCDEQKITRYEYNSLGQKTAYIKPDGQKVAYTYDHVGRLHNVSAPLVSYTYHYDLFSRPIQVTDILGKSTLKTYNAYGFLESETLSTGLKTQYTYDLLDRVTAVTLPDSSSIYYRYDEQFLKEIIRNESSYLYEDYDLSGKLLKGLGITYTYDPAGRLTRWEKGDFFEDLKYDPTGNLLSKNSTPYTYDDLYQLTSDESHNYTHDSLYNRTSKDASPYTLNDINQLISTASASYSYDKNGNLTHKNNTQYTYDGLDRLIKLETPTETHTYTYDENNRRLTDNNTQFLYSGENEIGSQSPLKTELRILGIGKGAEIGASVAFEFNQQTFQPLHDVQGSVIALFQNNIPIETYSITPYGENFSSTLNPWGFLSKRHENDLILFGRRFYDPEIGRWITTDPLGFSAGPNLYAYCSNSPLTHLDLYGLAEEGSFLDRASSFIKDACNSIRDCFSRATQSTCNFVHNAGHRLGRGMQWTAGKAFDCLEGAIHHLVPHLPGIKDVLGGSVHLLKNGTLNSYTPCLKQERGFIGYIPGKKSPNGIYVEYDGICTSKEEMHKRVSDNLARLDGIEGYYIHAAPHGSLTDLISSAFEIIGIITHASKLNAELLCNLYENNKSNPNLMIRGCGFSRGNLIFELGFKIAQKIHPDIGNNITYVGVATPYVYSNLNCDSIAFCASSRDWVSAAAMIFSKNANFTIFSSTALPFQDHKYDNNMYKEFRKEHFFNQFLKQP